MTGTAADGVQQQFVRRCFPREIAPRVRCEHTVGMARVVNAVIDVMWRWPIGRSEIYKFARLSVSAVATVSVVSIRYIYDGSIVSRFHVAFCAFAGIVLWAEKKKKKKNVSPNWKFNYAVEYISPRHHCKVLLNTIYGGVFFFVSKIRQDCSGKKS